MYDPFDLFDLLNRAVAASETSLDAYSAAKHASRRALGYAVLHKRGTPGARKERDRFDRIYARRMKRGRKYGELAMQLFRLYWDAEDERR